MKERKPIDIAKIQPLVLTLLEEEWNKASDGVECYREYHGKTGDSIGRDCFHNYQGRKTAYLRAYEIINQAFEKETLVAYE